MRTRGGWILLVCLTIGCSTSPVVDTLDFFKPGRLYPDRTAPYGGVCIPQGFGPTATTPSAVPGPPAVPPPVPFPPGGSPIVVPNLPPPGGASVPITPPPAFPVAPG